MSDDDAHCEDSTPFLPVHEQHLELDEKLPPPEGAKRATAFLDGLRGVAALCVFNQHLIGGIAHQHGFGENGNYYVISLPFLRVFYSGGGAAVAVFFVLSGFVISQNAVGLLRRQQEKKCRSKLIAAAVQRPIRLYLPCLVVTLIVAIAMQLPNNIYPSLIFSQPQSNILAQLWHWLRTAYSFFQPFQHHEWTSPLMEYDLPLWTIPIELKGSYLVYFLVTLSSLAASKYMPMVLACLTVLLLQFGFWSAGCFTSGLTLTATQAYYPSLLEVSRGKVSKAISGAFFVCGWYLLSQPVSDGHPEWSLDTPGWYILTSCIPRAYNENMYYRFWGSYGATFLIAGTLRMQWIQKLLETSPLQYLGRISFMLYLIHQPVFFSITDRLRRIYGTIPGGSSPKPWDNLLWLPDIGPLGLSLRWDVEYVTVLIVCLLIAHVVTRHVDTPSVQLARLCTKRLGLK